MRKYTRHTIILLVLFCIIFTISGGLTVVEQFYFRPQSEQKYFISLWQYTVYFMARPIMCCSAGGILGILLLPVSQLGVTIRRAELVIGIATTIVMVTIAVLPAVNILNSGVLLILSAWIHKNVYVFCFAGVLIGEGLAEIMPTD